MPMYDYRCDRCHVQFEVRQSFSDDTLTICPAENGPADCASPGEGPVKKVFSGVGISFKGDGFYKNDHGANANGRQREREPASAKDSESKEPSKSAGKSSESSSSSDSGSSRATADAGTSSS